MLDWLRELFGSTPATPVTPPVPDTEPAALSAPADGRTYPTGAIRATPPWGGRFGLDWSAVTRWAPQAEQAAAEFSVPVQRILAHVVIESGGNPQAVQVNASNGNSYGLMQIVPYGVGWDGHHLTVKGIAGLPTNASKQDVINALYDPLTNLRVGAKHLAGLYRTYGSWDRASSAFFLGNPDWRGADTVNGNTGDAYRRSLNALIAELDATLGPDPSGAPAAAPGAGAGTIDPPKVYDLRADYALFGLNGAEATTILNKRYIGRRGARPEVIVCHIQDGFTKGSLKHWVGVQASSNVMIQRDGSILRVINDEDAPWTNGDVQRPSGIGQQFISKFGADPNLYSLTIEAEGFPSEAITPAQWNAILWQVLEWMRTYPWLTLDRIVGHRDFNSVTREHCGKYVPDLKKALQSGDYTIPKKYPGLTIPDDVFESLFVGEVRPDPNGAFTRYLAGQRKYVPVFKLVQHDDASYLVTGDGLLRYDYATKEIEWL